MNVLNALTLKTPVSRTMNLLIATVVGGHMIIRVPLFHAMKTEIDQLNTTYGGVFAMDLSLFLKTHECVPLFETPTALLERTKTSRLLVLIPDGEGGTIQRLYASDFWKRQEPLFMFDRELYLKFVRAELVLEYSNAP